MALENRPYRGWLHLSIILNKQGPKLVKVKTNFTDPETQTVLPLIKSDLAEILIQCNYGSLSEKAIKVENQLSVSVVMTSGGYPESYERGKKILGLNREFDDKILIFHEFL